MNKTSYKLRFYYILILAVLIINMLSGCNTTTNSSNEISEQAESENDTFDKGTVYTMLVTNSNSNEALKEKFTIPVDNLEQPFKSTFENVGKDREFVMTVFYDYEQIEFSVDDTKNFSDKYVFSLKDNEEASFNFYLDPTIKTDGKSHKLLVNFIAGYDVYAKDIGTFDNSYGINTLYDIYYTSYNNDLDNDNEYINMENIQTSQTIFHDFISLPLALNTDYDNQQQEDSMIAYPENPMIVEPNENVELMYNISNESYDSAAFITMLGYQQINMDEKSYFYIPLSKYDNSVYNGSFSFKAPSKKGFYEVIGMVIFDPDKTASESNQFNGQYSLRFTLQVK
ncbi:hypothetical protein [Anaerosporobacter sp.]